MSKRHQSNRRKSYGRRQHEVYERTQKERGVESLDAVRDDLSGALAERFAFLDGTSARMRYAAGD